MTGSGTQFAFSNPIHKSDDPSQLMEYNVWAERIKGQHSYFGKPSTAKLGPWTRRVATDQKQEESGSGTPSPELWKKKEESPLLLIQSADSSPVRIQGGYYGHSSQSQTIARYRQEMLDLVRDVPEMAYELSLRDLVESPKITTPLQQQEETVEENSEEGKMESSSSKKKKKKRSNKKKEVRRISRSESIDMGGFFLRMFTPRLPSFLGGKRSSGGDDSGTCAKVSPKPVLGDGEKSTDRDWWNSEFGPMTISSGSSSSTSSTGSISSRTIRGCYSFFRTR